jgi:hypothetical protein
VRFRIVSMALTLALAGGCRCGSKLVSEVPQLVVIQPQAKDGAQWVLDFGDVPVGSSRSSTIVVQNAGFADGTLETDVLRNGSDPAFTLGAVDTPATLHPNDSWTLTVNVRAQAAGAITGFVDLTTSDPALKAPTVMLKANGVQGHLVVCVDGSDGGVACSDVEAAPLHIDFGSVSLGTTASRNVRVSNDGTVPVDYFGTTLASGATGPFALVPDQAPTDAGTALAAGAQILFAVTFAPTVDGAASTVATVSSDDVVAPSIPIQINGVGVESLTCKLKVTPPSVGFGSVPNNAMPADAALTITNVGLQSCTVSTLALTGSMQFSLPAAPATPLVLAPNGSAPVTVRYTPTGTSVDMGNLGIDSDDPLHSHIDVPLSAESIEPPGCTLTAQPSALSFGPVMPGQVVVQDTALTPNGMDICLVQSFTFMSGSGTFSTSATAPAFVGSFMGSLNVPVAYSPQLAGHHVDTMLVNYKAGITGPTLTLSVPLSGSAGAPQLCVLPTALHYGAVAVGQQLDLAFQMTACAQSAVHVQSITIEPPGEFSLPAPLPSFPETVAVGASVPQTVRFAPTSTALVSAKAHIVSDDPVFPDLYVSLDNAAQTPCVVRVKPATVNFGVLQPNTPVQKQVTVSNAGSGTCDLTNITFSGAAAGFSAPGLPATLSIPSGMNAAPWVVQADLPPGAPVHRTGSITFNSNDAHRPMVSVTISAFLDGGVGPYSQGWPKLFSDNANTSSTTADTAGVTGTVLWTYEMVPPSSSADAGFGAINTCPTFGVSPVVGPDGTVYQLDLGGTLHAIDPTGQPLWHSMVLPSPATDPFGATPFLAADGTIYVTGGSDSMAAGLYHLDSGGALLKSVPASAAVSGQNAADGYDVAPLLGSQGDIFAFDDFPGVILYDSSLTVKQIVALPGGMERAGLALAGDDSSFWNFSGVLTRLDPPATSLATKWHYSGMMAFGATNAIGGLVSLSSVGGYVLMSAGWLVNGKVSTGVAAVDPKSGTEVWKTLLPGKPATSQELNLVCQDFTTDSGNNAPSLGVDGTVYVGSADGLYALDPATGAVKTGWPFMTTAAVSDTVSIGGDGALFFGTVDGTFYGLNADGTQRFSLKVGGRISSSPAIGPDGTVFFVADDGVLYAVH